MARARSVAAASRPPASWSRSSATTGTGVELIAGVVRREPFGLVVALGLGGTLTEVLDLVAVRMFPLPRARRA